MEKLALIIRKEEVAEKGNIGRREVKNNKMVYFNCYMTKCQSSKYAN